METDSLTGMRASWSTWADFLRHWGLDGLAAWLLESASPLTVLGAQALLIGGPLLHPAVSHAQVEALVGLLEERSEAMAFATFLREESSA